MNPWFIYGIEVITSLKFIAFILFIVSSVLFSITCILDLTSKTDLFKKCTSFPKFIDDLYNRTLIAMIVFGILTAVIPSKAGCHTMKIAEDLNKESISETTSVPLKTDGLLGE